MQIIRDYTQLFESETPIAVALGYFDGLHLGHQKIIECTDIPNHKRGILTFTNQPAGFITHSRKPSRLLSLDDKVEMMEKMGTEYLFLYDFTEEIKNMHKDEFIDIFLVQHHVKYTVAGFNFRFGKDKEGDTAYLQKACDKKGIQTLIIPPVRYQGKVISSSLIRKKLYEGDVSVAAEMLGRSFYIKGEVQHGKHLGRTLGMPTANIHVADDIIVPKWGVYQTKVVIREQVYNGVTNVGNNPTIIGDQLQIETHILDFDDDIYGQEITIEFVQHIRDEIAFSDILALKNQVRQDIEFVRSSLDAIHKRGESVL